MPPYIQVSNEESVVFYDGSGWWIFPSVGTYSTGALPQFAHHPGIRNLPEHAFRVVNEVAVDQVLGYFALPVGPHDIYVCLVCGQHFSNLLDARLHIHLHWNTVHPLECMRCDRKFTGKSSAQMHAKISERRFRCLICDESYARDDYLLVHAMRCARGVRD